MSKKKKRNTIPSLPGKLKDPPVEKDRTTRRDWENVARGVVKRYRKVEKKSSNYGILARAELKGAMEQRRMEATLNLIDEIYARYSSYADAPHNTLGEEWIHLNLLFHTYSIIETQSHILTAAAIWILDRVRENNSWKDLYRILPKDESLLDDLNFPDVWDPLYEEDLIYSVQLVLQERNDPVEESPDIDLQCITDEKTAQGTHRSDTPSRKAFEALMALVPEEDKKRAAERFEVLFWACADRSFHAIEPLTRKILDIEALLDQQRIEYNRHYDLFLKAADEWDKSMNRPQMKLTSIPSSIPDLHDFSLFSGRLSTNQFLSNDRYKQNAYEKAQAMESIAEKYDELSDRLDSAHDKHFMFMNRIVRQGYISNCDEYGEDVVSNMKRLDIDDPFEICFALLYLVDQGSDLPWAYGVGTSLMAEVTESLPWGVIEYDEFEDDIWSEEGEREPVKVPANASIPDMNVRQYHRRRDEEVYFPRSISQLIYEETGCLLPRDIHLYDERINVLRRFGVNGKDAAVALACMSILGHARRQRRALNFESGPWYWNKDYHEIDNPEESQEAANEDSEQVSQLKEEIKRLRSSLHEADRASRDAKKDLENVKQKAALEHRELADLRELVFYEAKEEANEPDEEETNTEFPYSVQKNTVVFGGHPSWEKAIRPLLTGNIKFVEKDLITFDLALVRGADIVWIQSNAMSHKMYYRIIDTARQYKKTVRYFTNASAIKCAVQVIGEDESKTTRI